MTSLLYLSVWLMVYAACAITFAIALMIVMVARVLCGGDDVPRAVARHRYEGCLNRNEEKL